MYNKSASMTSIVRSIVSLSSPELVDDADTSVPEPLLVRLDEEGLEGVADLVAHVAVRQVQAGQHHRLHSGFHWEKQLDICEYFCSHNYDNFVENIL